MPLPARMEPTAVSAVPVRQVSANDDATVPRGVELGAYAGAHARRHGRMHVTLRGALQLVSRLCDRSISERERTDCALRARGDLRLLEQMMDECMDALAPAPVRRQQAVNPQED